MKKFLALTSAIILSLSCFAGCGDKDDSKDSSSSEKSASSSSKSDLNKTADTAQKAFDAAAIDMEEEGLDSNGMYTSDSKDDLSKAASDYFNDLNNYEWVCIIKDGAVAEIYVADDWDSKTIGTYPKDLDTDGKTLADFK